MTIYERIRRWRKWWSVVTDPAPAPEPAPAPAPAPAPVPTPSPFLDMRGANLVGGSTAWTGWSIADGPVYGTNCKFVSNAEVDRCIANGMNTFRLLFTWEALQPAPYNDINANVGNYKIYADKLFALVTYITSKGANVILDIHGDIDAGFAAYRSVKVGALYDGHKIEDLLENLWRQLARKYKDNPRVLYGITNEPHDISAAVWYACAQKVLNGIRSEGATAAIIMPGTDWTGAGSWTWHNSAGWNLSDPLNNTQVQVHLYLDANAGGGTTEIVSPTIGVERMKGVVEWARSKGLKVYLGEIGLSASNPIGQQAWNNLHNYLLANRDVCSGFAFWALGPKFWWDSYRFTLNNGTGTSPQLQMIQGALK